MNFLNKRFQVSGFKFYVLLFLFFPLFTFAQGTIFISPADGIYEVGELFSVLINANTGSQPINAGTAQINFDNQRLEVQDIGYSRSIFNLWTEEPKFSNVAGTIRFSGGLPNPGFVGSSGSMLRVTFKGISAGQASVIFTSGSLLANDGQGTNILDSLKGGLFTIITKKSSVEEKSETKLEEKKPEVTEGDGRSFAPPEITQWPQRLEEGSFMTIKGLGYPKARVLLYVQRGSETPIENEILALDDGRFFFTYEKPIETGLYRIWAKNVSQDGAVSPSSEVITIEVVKPLFLRIGSMAFDYVSIIVTLVILIILLVVLVLRIILQVRKWQKRQGKEIHEAEEMVHESFDKLKTGIRNYVRYLLKGRTEQGIKKRENAMGDEFESGLSKIEKEIEKEIEDIKKPKKRV